MLSICSFIRYSTVNNELRGGVAAENREPQQTLDQQTTSKSMPRILNKSKKFARLKHTQCQEYVME